MNTGALGHMVDEQRFSSNLVSRERKLWERVWLVSVGGKEKKNKSNYSKSRISFLCE